MAGVAEENRRRIATALCLAGLVLIVAGAGLIAYHYQPEVARDIPRPPHAPGKNIELAKTIQILLFWLLILVGIFGVSTLAFLRWSRRFRRWLLRRPGEPTPADDVWTQHRLPDDLTEPGGPDADLPEPGGER